MISNIMATQGQKSGLPECSLPEKIFLMLLLKVYQVQVAGIINKVFFTPESKLASYNEFRDLIPGSFSPDRFGKKDGVSFCN